MYYYSTIVSNLNIFKLIFFQSKKLIKTYVIRHKVRWIRPRKSSGGKVRFTDDNIGQIDIATQTTQILSGSVYILGNIAVSITLWRCFACITRNIISHWRRRGYGQIE